MFYVYRCTADKLEHHLNRVTEAGDEVVWPVFLRGRDWLLVCRKLRAGVGTVTVAGPWASSIKDAGAQITRNEGDW